MTQTPIEDAKSIDSDGWKLIILKLTRYALFRLKLYTWYGKRGGEIARYKSAEDYAMQAVEKYLDGTRNWNSKKCDLLGFLKGIIKSDMGHEAKEDENKLSTRWDAPSESGLENERMLRADNEPEPSPSDKEINKEIEVAEQTIADQFIDFIGKDKDKDLMKILECLMDGVIKPQDISQRIGKNIAEVNNLKKKFQRRLEEFQKLHPGVEIEAIKEGA